MANTQVFTVGVTVSQPSGRVFDALRQSLVQLRRQADDTRLGRMVNEVIRLGLELDKVRQVDRQLALDQAEGHEAQIDRLRREGDEVQRLRGLYLSLGRRPLATPDQAGAAKAAERPAPGYSLEERKAALLDGVTPQPRPAVNDPPLARSPEQGRVPLEQATSGLRVVGAVAAGAATVGGTVALYKGYRRLPEDRRREATKSVREKTGVSVVTALTKGMLAFNKEDGQDQAEGVGGALGELVGSLGGALLGGLTKNKHAAEYLSLFGGMAGESVGGALGKSVFNWFSDKPAGKDGVSGDGSTSPAPAVERAGSSLRSRSERSAVDDARFSDGDVAEEEVEEEEEEEEEEEQEAQEDEAYYAAQERPASAERATQSSVGELGSASFAGLASRAGASTSLARKAFRRVPGVGLLDTGLQLAETYTSDAPTAQKLEGYASAVGGLGGTLAGAAAGAAIGSVVPVIGTAIGGLLGGVLGSMGGESIGGWLGKAMGVQTGEAQPSAGKEAGEPSLGAVAPVLNASSTSTPAAPAPINQQFTFTANMPVTFTNSLDDPNILQQLEAIARRQLEELMLRARSVQLADQPQPF